MQKQIEVFVPYDQYPAVQEAIAQGNLKLGDALNLDTRSVIKSLEPEGCRLIVNAYVPEGYEVSDAEETPGPGPTGPGTDEAMMSPMAMAVRKKKGS